MLRIVTLSVLALLTTGLDGAAAAKPQSAKPGSSCRDDAGAERCTDQAQRRLRELYGLRTIEEHRARGDQLRRAFYVDGYGRDLIAIAFVRAPGHDPVVQVHFPLGEGEPAARPMEAPVPKAVWEHVLDRSWLFDRTLVPLNKEGKDGSITICLHAWVFTVEAVDPAEPGADSEAPPPRRKTGDACDDELVQDYADELQRAAIGLFPSCAALDPEQHRGDASRLAACRILTGDRLAAAEVFNRWDAFRRARTAEEANFLAGIFALGAVIDWQGSIHRGAAPEQFWLARVADSGRPVFFVELIEGLSSRRVRLSGIMARSEERPEGERELRAPVEQIWVFTPSQQYQVESVKVGAFKASAP